MVLFVPERQLPNGPQTVNELWFDALIRHQIGLMNFSGFVRNRSFELLDATEEEIAGLVRRRIDRLRGLRTPADARRLDQLIERLRRVRTSAWDRVDELQTEQLRDMTLREPRTVDGLLRTVAPADPETGVPAEAALLALLLLPFEGRTLNRWQSDARRADLGGMEAVVRRGAVQGLSGASTARAVVGTARTRGTDGFFQSTRNRIATLIRTAVNAFGNFARRRYYEENDDLFSRELYVAVLDGRTSPICRSLDGRIFPVGQGQIPPIHPNCRSTRIAIIDGLELSERPARPFTERQLLREFTDGEGLSRVSERARLPRGFKGRFDAFRRARIRELTGRTPPRVTYAEWLGRQSRNFQDEVLGPTRARLFRRGGLTLDRFVDRRGRQIPLDDLARRDRQSFVDAGLDPEEFL